MAEQGLTAVSNVHEFSVDDLLKHIEWTDESLPLAKFVEKYKLPQLVKVEEGYYGAADESSLSTGQILKVHYTRTSMRARARDRVGNEVHLPLHTSHRVMLRPRNYKVVYASVADLAQANPLPNFVEITQGYYNVDSSDSQELSVEPGEKLEVGAVEVLNIRGHRRRYMTFTSLNGVEVKLPFNCMAGFKPYEDIEAHLLSDIVKTNTMPVYVQFVVAPTVQVNEVDRSNALMRLGVLKLEQIYSEDLIIASCGYNNTHVVFTIPKSLAITVKVAAGTFRGDNLYSEICEAYHDFTDLEARVAESHERDLFSGPGGLKEYEYEYIDPSSLSTLPSNNTPKEQGKPLVTNWSKAFPEDKVVTQGYSILTVSDDSIGERPYEMDTATQSSMGSTETFDSRSSVVDVDPYSSKGEADDELEYDYSSLGLSVDSVVQTKKGTRVPNRPKSENKTPFITGPVNQVVSENHNTKTDATLVNVNGDLDFFAPAVSVSPITPTFGSDSVIQEAGVILNPIIEDHTENQSVARKASVDIRQSDSTASDTDESTKIASRGNLWDNVGPIDSGNLSSTSDGLIYSSRAKQVDRRGRPASEMKHRSRSVGPRGSDLILLDETVSGPEGYKERSFSNPLISEGSRTGVDFKFSHDLSSLDIEEVCRCLHRLNLGHLEQTFRHNQINGGLLVCLDDESLKDLKLTSFERRKMLTFIHGWRPDK